MRVLLRDIKTGGYFNRPFASSLSITDDDFEVTSDGETETFSRDRHVLLRPSVNRAGDDQ